MKRVLSIAVVMVSVTGLLGTGWVLAQSSMSMSGSGSGAGSGGPGMGSVGGWSLAPEAGATKKTTTTAANTAGTATAVRTTAGAWSVPEMPDAKNSKIEVKNLENGVSITFTSADRPTAARLQKMGQAMRLMHEAMSP